MKKILVLAALAVLSAAPLAAQSKNQNIPLMMTTDGELKALSSLELYDSGDYKYAERGKDAKLRMPKSRVKWAWAPKTDDVDAADKLFKEKKYPEAAQAYAEAAKKSGPLGWRPYCIYLQARALKEAGKPDDAFQVLKTLENYPNACEKNELPLALAYSMLVDFYIDAKNFKDAEQVAAKLLYAQNSEAAVRTMLTLGDLYSAEAAASPADAKQKLRDAAMSYFQACLLFPRSKNAPEAAYKSWETLTKLKDGRAQTFAEMLKQDYADSEYAKKLP